MVASSYLNINCIGFLILCDIKYFIDLKRYLFSATASPLPSPSTSLSSLLLSGMDVISARCQGASRAGCPARKAEPGSRVKQGRQGRDCITGTVSRVGLVTPTSIRQWTTARHASAKQRSSCEAKETWVSQDQPRAWPGTGSP